MLPIAGLTFWGKGYLRMPQVSLRGSSSATTWLPENPHLPVVCFAYGLQCFELLSLLCNREDPQKHPVSFPPVLTLVGCWAILDQDTGVLYWYGGGRGGGGGGECPGSEVQSLACPCKLPST